MCVWVSELEGDADVTEETLKTEEDGFWADKLPCWQIRGCPDAACRECVAYRKQDRPCWELDTICKRLLGSRTCRECEVFKLYGSVRNVDD